MNEINGAKKKEREMHYYYYNVHDFLMALHTFQRRFAVRQLFIHPFFSSL
jgi:hypothetical protein